MGGADMLETIKVGGGEPALLEVGDFLGVVFVAVVFVAEVGDKDKDNDLVDVVEVVDDWGKGRVMRLALTIVDGDDGVFVVLLALL